jgi:hypothetical protein
MPFFRATFFRHPNDFETQKRLEGSGYISLTPIVQAKKHRYYKTGCVTVQAALAFAGRPNQ